MSALFTEFKIGDLILKNRVVMAPLTRGRCAAPLKTPNDLHRIYYEQRAGAGLIISEATAISEQAYGWYGAPGCYNKEQSDAWKPVVDAVHAKKGLIFMQLWHIGRQGHSSFHKNEVVAASALKIPTGKVRDINYVHAEYCMPRALETEEVAEIVQDFKNCAAFAKLAGFDGVEIHGANGYLIDNFLQTCSNKRTDIYGGSMENRFRFLKEVVAVVSEVYPIDRIGVRISPNGVFGNMGSSDNDVMFLYVASQLNGKVGYIHVLDGLGYGWHNLCKQVKLIDIKKKYDGVIISNIDLTKDIAEGVIRTGTADLACFGRLYINNPDLAERMQNDWPLSTQVVPHEHWYVANGDIGYTDYPPYDPELVKK